LATSPNQLLSEEITERLKISRNTWTSYVSRGQAPAPDGYLDGRTPYWLDTTIDAYEASRPSKRGSDAPQPRRRYTAEEKAQMLADFDASGLTAREFALERGLTVSMFAKWVSARDASTGESPEAGQTGSGGRRSVYRGKPTRSDQS
jgi:transposase-like protein